MRPRTRPRFEPMTLGLHPQLDRKTHCVQTRRLRVRAREAEARAQAAEAKTAEVLAEMDALRRAVHQERRDAIAAAEGPDWHRGLLLMARDRVRDGLIALATRHDSCAACGSFGRGFYEGFLQDEIDAVTRAHDLPPVTPPAPIDWPVSMGRRILKGRVLTRIWLEQAAQTRRQRGMGDWDR